ncbi:MAG: hypothetical protein HZA22_07535 [Nitrospirae bacterium]|nr:hypothetical protein [Nitrospirota bacterium]
MLSDGSDNKIQKGLREYLLCSVCEGKLSAYEKYAYENVLKKLLEYTFSMEEYLYFEDVDYRRFKLFLLSVLWRAGITSIPTFQSVSLGPHEGKLRDMILKENPGEEGEYPCLLY